MLHNKIKLNDYLTHKITSIQVSCRFSSLKTTQKMSFPSKEVRQNCWSHRDKYWQCLDEGKSQEECREFRKQYEKFCPSQWVKHFDRKRDYLKFKEQIEKGGYVEEEPKKT